MTATEAPVDFAQATDARFTLHYAAKIGNLARVRELVGRDTVITNARERETSWAALHYAGRHGHAEVARFLLQNLGDANLKDDTGCTPLHLAAGWGNLETASTLLEFGADRTLENSQGLTPAQVAHELGRADVAGYIDRWDQYALGGTMDDREKAAAELAQAEAPVVVEARARGEPTPIFEQLHVLSVKEALLGTQHIGLGFTLQKLAAAYRAEGRLGDAQEVLRRLVALAETRRDHGAVEGEASVLAAEEEAAAVAAAAETDAAAEVDGEARGDGKKQQSEELQGAPAPAKAKRKHPRAAELAVAAANSKLGDALYADGSFGEAQQLFEKALDVVSEIHGDTHADTVACLENLALCLQHLGNYAAAEPLLERSLAAQQQLYEPYPGKQQHVGLVRALNLLGGLAMHRGAFDDAFEYFSRGLEQVRYTHGEDHMGAAACYDQMALAKYHTGPLHWPESERLFRKSLALWLKHHPNDRTSVMRCQNNVSFIAAVQLNAKMDSKKLSEMQSKSTRAKGKSRKGGKREGKKKGRAAQPLQSATT